VKTIRSHAAFTLLELLSVIAIIGILAAITLPNLQTFKPNVMAAATSQLLADVGRARQLAISHRTTVYMVFVPGNFWADPASSAWRPADWERATNLFDKQLVGYNFVSLRSLGDQPGRPTTRYLSEWRTIPEGAFIPLQKFGLRNPMFPNLLIATNDLAGNRYNAYAVLGFSVTNNIPFPLDTTPGLGTPPRWVPLPYIAFNYMGQLISGQNEQLPVALGSVGFSRDATRQASARSPSVTETPPGNSTNSYNLVNIDWLTGRARIERQEAR
jgi:prepilin-type N-terminal cleavage/methylation domain-containing protein